MTTKQLFFKRIYFYAHLGSEAMTQSLRAELEETQEKLRRRATEHDDAERRLADVIHRKRCDVGTQVSKLKKKTNAFVDM